VKKEAVFIGGVLLYPKKMKVSEEEQARIAQDCIAGERSRAEVDWTASVVEKASAYDRHIFLDYLHIIC
jgi:hypothetical protein